MADASHFGLFALAAYMAQKNYEVNSIVDVLRVRSDFDERVAKYQIEHIAGMSGSRVKYKPPSCQAMRVHGLCVDNGKHCHGIKNPLQYHPTSSAGPRWGSDKPRSRTEIRDDERRGRGEGFEPSPTEPTGPDRAVGNEVGAGFKPFDDRTRLV